MTEPLLVVNVRVQPSAKKDEISGWMDDGTLKVRVRGKPVEGKANQSLVNFLSKALGVSKSNIEILSGDKSRNKRLQISGIDRSAIDHYLSEQGN
ncbi:MAG: uncharacterized protein PWQ55_400 [Chloroflexota bacterium]|nr:uncharacterized protein [Chloroflexota bacterium]